MTSRYTCACCRPRGPSRTSLDHVKDPLRYEVPVAVAIGGALGSLGRWGVADVLPTSSQFPWPTFVVNVSGTFVLGIVLVLGEKFHPQHHRAWARLWRPFLATGVLGGFTTFSALSLELVQLGFDAALTYVVCSIVFGLLAFAVGSGITRRIADVNA